MIHKNTLRHPVFVGRDYVQVSYEDDAMAVSRKHGARRTASTAAAVAVTVTWTQNLTEVESKPQLGVWMSLAYSDARRDFHVVLESGTPTTLVFELEQTRLRADTALHFQAYTSVLREEGNIWPGEAGSGGVWLPALLLSGHAEANLTLAWDRMHSVESPEVRGTVQLEVDTENSLALDSLRFYEPDPHDLIPARVAHARQAAFNATSLFMTPIDRKTLRANRLDIPYTSPSLDRIFAPYSPGMCPPVPMMPSYIFYRLQREELHAVLDVFLREVFTTALNRSGLGRAEWLASLRGLLNRGIYEGERTRLCLAVLPEAAQLVALQLPYVGDYMVHRGDRSAFGFGPRSKPRVQATDLYSDALRITKRVKDCEDAARVIARILMAFRRYEGADEALREARRIVRAYVIFGFNGAVNTGRADQADQNATRLISYEPDPATISSHGAVVLMDPRQVLETLQRTYPRMEELPRGLMNPEDAPRSAVPRLPMQIVEGTGRVGTIPLSPVWYDGLKRGNATVDERQLAINRMTKGVGAIFRGFTGRVENNDKAEDEAGRAAMGEYHPNFFHQYAMHLFAVHDEDTPDSAFEYVDTGVKTETVVAQEVEARAHSCMAMHVITTHAEGARKDGARATFGGPLTYMATGDERIAFVMTPSPHPSDSLRMRMAYQHMAPPPLLTPIDSPHGLAFLDNLRKKLQQDFAQSLAVDRRDPARRTHYISLVWKAKSDAALKMLDAHLANNEFVSHVEVGVDNYVEGHVNTVLGVCVFVD